MNEALKAVFLSYASQDAEAARRICDALRGTGVEVWFDQSELVGGDAWDAKIRRQIAECALFVPIISANTQARLEGYFRIEWKLAAQRTHAMADEKAFLLPVVIDSTRDGEAKVPAEFKAVQWTRFAGGETPAAFCERVKKLLGGDEWALTFQPVSSDDTGWKARATPSRRVPAAAWIGLAAVVAIGIGGFVAQRPSPNAGAGTRPPTAEKPAAPLSEAAKLAEAARRHYAGIFTREDLSLAEEFGRRATDLEPRLARAWAVRAGANAAYLLRGFVNGEAAAQRARDAQAFANRALAIDKDDVEALLALGLVADAQRATGQAEAYFRRVLALDPNDLAAPRFLSIVLRRTGRVPEAVALMKEAVRRAPRDALTHFDLALAYAQGWNFAKSFAACEASFAAQPFQGALTWQAWLAFQWKGDVDLMRALLDRVEVTHRSEEEAVWTDMMCGLFERRAARVIEAAGRTASDFLELWQLPKAWFTAQAYELDGKQNLARQQWQAAEAVLRERLRTDPQDVSLRVSLAAVLARLGRIEDGRTDLAAVESMWREQMTPGRAGALATVYAWSGDAAKAVGWLRQSVHQGLGIEGLTLHLLRADPKWDKIRDTAEFQAVLANPPPPPVPVEAPADPKSEGGGRESGDRGPKADARPAKK